jgi:uncharacterized hydrophobic protein (TIGR00271 family)
MGLLVGLTASGLRFLDPQNQAVRATRKTQQSLRPGIFAPPDIAPLAHLMDTLCVHIVPAAMCTRRHLPMAEQPSGLAVARFALPGSTCGAWYGRGVCRRVEVAGLRRPSGAACAPVSALHKPLEGVRLDGGTMIHLRAVSPPDITDALVPMLRAEPAVMNLIVFRAAVSNPDGDAVHFDVLQGAADDIIGRLRQLGVEQRGSIVLENVDASLHGLADSVSACRTRFQQFTPVWTEVEARIRLGGSYPPSWFGLLVIAGLIGAVGILTNSEILIVGAMVVGPEYGAILSLGFGVTRHDYRRVAHAAAALVIGFTLAVAGALALSLVIRWAGLEPRAYALGIRPVSSLIDTPNWFSFIVALLAGVVGVISVTESRSSALIGVFISVTTIPAAADIGVSLAFGSGSEAWGSTLQLLLNVTVLTAVTIAGLPTQRALWRRAAHRRANREALI